MVKCELQYLVQQKVSAGRPASFEQEALYEVDAALQRIDDGTYGFCELTGRPIPWKQLEAIPWTRFSIEAEIHPVGWLAKRMSHNGGNPDENSFA